MNVIFTKPCVFFNITSKGLKYLRGSGYLVTGYVGLEIKLGDI